MATVTAMRNGLLLVLAIGVAVPAVAPAVDVVNEDRRAHEVTIAEKDRPGVWSQTIEPGETLADVCIQCTIEVDNLGRIDAAGAEVITIRDGRLRKAAN